MKGRRRATFAVLLTLLVVLVPASIALGAVRVSALALPRIALGALGVQVAQPASQERAIVLFIRLPRVCAALLVGFSLAACGVAMQGLFRNPMASPEILGVSAGASLGAVTAINTGLFAASVLFMPALTIAGALLSSTLIYLVASRRGKTSLLFVVLAGLAISSFFNGLVSAILMFSQQYEVSQYIFWTMGGLDGRLWRHITLPLPFLAAGLVALFLFTRELNLFAFGEEGAHALGVHVERTKRLVLAISAAVTGLAISIGGPIGFVGLLVPHFLRLLVGPDHRVLLPASALGGAVFLLLSDLLGRVVAPPFEIRVGIITAVVGSPYFIFLIVRAQRRGLGGTLR